MEVESQHKIDFDDAASKADSGISLEDLESVCSDTPASHGLVLVRETSCSANKVFSTCVNKAIFDLETLKAKLEIGIEDDDTSSTESRFPRSQLTSSKASRKILRFSATSSALNREPSFSDASSVTAPNELSVLGVGGKSDSERFASASVAHRPVSSDQWSSVVNNVLSILVRLEKTRLQKGQDLKKEKKRGVLLREKLDRLQRLRLKEFPRAVQREHEACARDLSELQWHVATKSRQDRSCQMMLETAQALNERLKDELSFIEQTVPLMEEKVALEEETLRRVKETQQQTDQELAEAKAKQARTELQHKEANDEADVERKKMKKELDDLENNLKSTRDGIEKANKSIEKKQKKCEELREEIRVAKEERQICINKKESAEATEVKLTKKIRELQSEIDSLNEEVRMLETELRVKQKLLKEFREKTRKEIDEVTTTTQKIDEVNEKRLVGIQEAEFDIDELKKKAVKTDKLRNDDETRMSGMSETLIKLDKEVDFFEREVKRLQKNNTSIRDGLRNETLETKSQQESIENSLEALRLQTKEDSRTRTMMQARLESDETDHDVLVKQLGDRKQKEEQKLARLTDDVKQKKGQLGHSEKELSSLEDTVRALQNDNALLRHQIQKAEADYENEMKKLRPVQEALKRELTVTQEEMAMMSQQTKDMNNHIVELGREGETIDRVHKRIEAQIAILTKHMTEAQAYLDTAESVQNDMDTRLKEVKDRGRVSIESLNQLTADRNRHYSKLQWDIECMFQENDKLAASYRQLQNDIFLRTDQLHTEMEKCLKFLETCCDMKQVQGLQQRMTHALSEYHQLKNIKSETSIKYLETEQRISGHELKLLQQRFENSVTSMNKFLASTPKGRVTRIEQVPQAV